MRIFKGIYIFLLYIQAIKIYRIIQNYNIYVNIRQTIKCIIASNNK